MLGFPLVPAPIAWPQSRTTYVTFPSSTHAPSNSGMPGAPRNAFQVQELEIQNTGALVLARQPVAPSGLDDDAPAPEVRAGDMFRLVASSVIGPVRWLWDGRIPRRPARVAFWKRRRSSQRARAFRLQLSRSDEQRQAYDSFRHFHCSLLII